MAHVMIARCAPAPSSPAQARAATRLRGYDGPDATEPTGLPFHQCTLIDLTTEQKERLHPFGKGLTRLPERGPDAGTMDQVIVSRRRESVVLNER